jgi:hypothetical protein
MPATAASADMPSTADHETMPMMLAVPSWSERRVSVRRGRRALRNGSSMSAQLSQAAATDSAMRASVAGGSSGVPYAATGSTSSGQCQRYSE